MPQSTPDSQPTPAAIPAATPAAVVAESAAAGSEEEWVRNMQVKPRAASVARHLRELADRVERTALDYDRVGSRGAPSYASVTARIQHEVLWGLANASIDSLTNDAIMADDARINRR